jgi:hypothetical protein
LQVSAIQRQSVFTNEAINPVSITASHEENEAVPLSPAIVANNDDSVANLPAFSNPISSHIVAHASAALNIKQKVRKLIIMRFF